MPLEAPGGQMREVTVWSSNVPAHDAGERAAAGCPASLAPTLRLVRFDTRQSAAAIPICGRPGAHTAFADGYPCSSSARPRSPTSTRGSRQARATLPMNRFRPTSFWRDSSPTTRTMWTRSWRGRPLRLVKPCTRCQVTTTDQSSAEVGTEPLPTLAAYRTHPTLSGVTFGMNAIIVAGAGHRLDASAPPPTAISRSERATHPAGLFRCGSQAARERVAPVGSAKPNVVSNRAVASTP